MTAYFVSTSRGPTLWPLLHLQKPMEKQCSVVRLMSCVHHHCEACFLIARFKDETYSKISPCLLLNNVKLRSESFSRMPLLNSSVTMELFYWFGRKRHLVGLCFQCSFSVVLCQEHQCAAQVQTSRILHIAEDDFLMSFAKQMWRVEMLIWWYFQLTFFTVNYASAPIF